MKEVASASAKLITLVDLAGHEKYIKTTGALFLAMPFLPTDPVVP
jgi:GTPase